MALLTVVVDEAALAVTAAERITAAVGEAIVRSGSAVVCLTGGKTPKRLYELLGDALQPWRARIDWRHVHLFWGDERHVPPDHPDSNFGMAYRALVSQVPVPASQVHRIRGEFADARDAGREYEAELRTGFAAAGRTDLTFDLMLLGLGENVHIASLFPGSPLLEHEPPPGALAAGVWVPELDTWRITLTPSALLDARRLVMLVSGARKADAVHEALEGEEDVVHRPAQLLRRANDRVEWIIDRPAAALLGGAPSA
jgi:6-phosphogluconolactonase